MKERLGRALPPLLGLGLFAVTLWVLHRTLQEHHFASLVADLRAVPPGALLLALGFSAASYLVLTGYDALALRYIGHHLPYRRIAAASFVGYAFSHNLGLALLSGGSVRYRLYSAWGLSAAQIAAVVAFCGITLWLGFFALGGIVLLVAPPALPPGWHLSPHSLPFIGALFLLIAATYLLWSLLRSARLRLGQWEFTLPRPPLAVGQIGLATLDWLLASAVLYALLPAASAPAYSTVLGVYLLAQIAGMASQIPGGLGVFETAILLVLGPTVGTGPLVASLVAYRIVYYFLPLLVAALVMAGLELSAHRQRIGDATRLVTRWIPTLAPQVIAITIFVGGVVLLLSGATPTVDWRLAWLRRTLPLPLVEISHFLNSLIGVGLLLLARGLQRRLDAAYHVTVGLLLAGIAVSLLKGFDYEEAIALGIVLAALLPSRRYFYRRASLIGERFSAAWIAAIAIAVLGSLWLGVFSYKHVEFSDELWWQFAFRSDAPRFLRASVGAISVLVIFGVARLLRTTPAEPPLPGGAELERAAAIAAQSPVAAAHLALTGDKHLLFGANAFLMYGIQGRAWVAMGDPVGPRAEWTELAWRFRELSHRHGGWTVFYQVAPDNLPLYLDLGLALLKLGEEARIDLSRFGLEGGERKGQRHLLNKQDRAGVTVEVLEPAAVSTVLAELKDVSDAWLAHKHTREKRFSLGFFDTAYLTRLPVAIVRHEGAIVAFANLWPGAAREELAIDLMRYRPDAAEGVMEYLFLKLMLWARGQGYRWFNLGMAPLAGLENRALAPLWNRLGALVFKHGEHFYNFQGLRQYKMKFNPVWTPRYLATPGGVALPQVLTQIAALIGGGYRGIVAK